MSELNKITIDWLLQSDHPSIHYAVHMTLLHQTPEPEEIIALTNLSSPIGQIMHQLQENTYWFHAKSFYSPKYRASHWSLLLLHEYYCPPELQNLSTACEHVLTSSRKNWLDQYAHKPIKDHELACFYGNVLRYAYAFGLGQHPDAQAMLDYLSQSKEGCEWCCIHNMNKPCLWGAIRTLWAYAFVPEAHRSPQIRASMQSALDLILNSRETLFSNAPNPDGNKQHALWGKISFPLYYQADRLFTLRVLKDHGQLSNPKVLPALQWLQSKRKANGHWQGSNPYRSSWRFGLESEEVDRWVTLQALAILVDAGLENLA